MTYEDSRNEVKRLRATGLSMAKIAVLMNEGAIRRLRTALGQRRPFAEH